MKNPKNIFSGSCILIRTFREKFKKIVKSQFLIVSSEAINAYLAMFSLKKSMDKF